MGGYSYSALEVVVTADTRGLTAQVRNAATKAGTEASSTINEHVGKGFKSLGPVVGKIGKAAATGLGLATTAAVAFGVKAFKAAAQVEAMNASLAALARANHVSYQTMQDQISALQRQGVEVEDAQKFVANLTRAHVNLANATKLGTIAQNASIVTGKSFADVSGAITKAIATGNAAALKRAGLYVDSKKALADYAAQIGKTTDELTSQEKQQAILNAVTKTGQTIQGAFAAQLKTPTGALRAMKLEAHDVTVELGMSLVKALTPAFAGMARFGRSLSEALAPGGKLAPIVEAIGTAAARTVVPVTALFNKLVTWFDKLKPGTIDAIANAIKRFGPALAGVGAASALFTGAGILDKLPVIGPLLSTMLGPVKSLTGAVGGLSGALKFLTGPVGIILTIFSTLMAVSPEFRQAVFGLVQALITALMPAFRAILAALKPLMPVIVLLGRMLGQILAPVIKALTPLIVQLVPLISVFATLVAKLLGVVLLLVMPVLKVYMAFEKWYVMKILIPVINILVGALTWLIRTITSLFHWIMGGSPGLVPAFLVLQRVVTSVTNTIRQVVVAGFTAMKNAIQAAWRFVSSNSLATWNTVRNIVTGAVRLLVGAVTNGFNTIRSVASRALSWLVNAVRNIAGGLRDAGASAIRAMLGGITSALAGIGSWVKVHIVDPVVNAVKNFFGIHSPSAVMAGLGHNVAEGFVQGIVEHNPLTIAKHIFGSIPSALGALVTKGMVDIGSLPGKALRALGSVGGAIKGMLTKITGFLGLGGGGGGGVMQWAGIMRAVLSHFGIPQLFGTFMTQMQTESGGNPRAINLWDSNAKAGIPSQGLMQVIPPTFAAYAGPYRSRGIMDPLANIYAAVAYAISRYGGSIGAVLGHGHGYAEGGLITEPITGFGHRTGTRYMFGEAGPEYVTPLTKFGARQNVVVNVYPQKGQSEVEIAAAVSRRLGWAAATGRA